MDTTTDAAIASPHWDACDTCQRQGENGCTLTHVDLSVYMGEILCDDYLPTDSPNLCKQPE